jgi:hypothetical protein
MSWYVIELDLADAVSAQAHGDGTMVSRWTSRKFLISLGAQLAAVAVLLWPQHESAIVEASRCVTALVVILASALGYVQAEASIDRSHGAAAEASPPGSEP